MRNSLLVLLSAMLVLAIAGCSGTSSGGGSSSAPGTASTSAAAPSAQAIWTETISNKAYKSWPTAPGYTTPQPAKGPHGKFVQIYVNPTVKSTLDGGAATAWPVGSIVVKDAYDANNQLMQIEYMQKTDQGWYFASYGVDGTIVKEGVQAQPCWACHSAKSADGIKSFKLTQ